MSVAITVNDNGDILSVDWEAFLLQELENPTKRDDIAETYSYILRTKGTRWDYRKVNQAIIDKWSPTALKYIKEKAWKLVEA